MPPPRGMFREMVAVLEAKVPTVLFPMALTREPVAGLTVTVIGVFKGRFEQLITIGIGLACWPEMMASGVSNCPLGLGDTEMPPMLTMLSWTP